MANEEELAKYKVIEKYFGFDWSYIFGVKYNFRYKYLFYTPLNNRNNIAFVLFEEVNVRCKKDFYKALPHLLNELKKDYLTIFSLPIMRNKVEQKDYLIFKDDNFENKIFSFYMENICHVNI